MRLGKFFFVVLFLTVSCASAALSETSKDEDFAVPAFSDLPLLAGGVTGQNRPIANEDPLPDVTQLKWLDINRDVQLNDFDIKQFQKIIESLNGDQLTGLQITIKFRMEQKNQKESFPLLYDLDRDGMFTPYDVDYFTGVINKLDDGALRGTELIQKYRLQIFPREQ